MVTADGLWGSVVPEVFGARGTEVSAERPREETREVSDGGLGEETRVLTGWEVVIE